MEARASTFSLRTPAKGFSAQVKGKLLKRPAGQQSWGGREGRPYSPPVSFSWQFLPEASCTCCGLYLEYSAQIASCQAPPAPSVMAQMASYLKSPLNSRQISPSSLTLLYCFHRPYDICFFLGGVCSVRAGLFCSLIYLGHLKQCPVHHKYL